MLAGAQSDASVAQLLAGVIVAEILEEALGKLQVFFHKL